MKVGLPALLCATAFVIACDGSREPTAPSARGNTSNVISDGAHGGANKDFFFLPPLMASPASDPNFDAGKFNAALRPSLQVQVCELGTNNLSAQGRPTDATSCTAATPIANFAPGSVQLVANPRSQIGWWTLFNLPADGFYYVLWDTHATSRLDASKYYRIKVSISGVPDLLGYADVDPIQNLTQWKNALTGEVIQMVNGTVLPIPFRIENGGGSVLCGTAALCNSGTVTNNSSTPQIIQVQGNNGPIAGVKIPDGKWLPDGGPQSVIFVIKQVNTGVNDQASGTQANPCHSAPIQQFNGCFNFTTIPALTSIPGTNDKFLKDITVAVCFVLADKTPLDPREPWVQLWSSDIPQKEAPRPLASAYSGDILSVHSEENCGTNYDPVITSNETGVSGLAEAGWRALSGGLGKFFGVKTAYAVDLGLGGLTKGTSNIGPGLTAKIIAHTATSLNLTTVEAATPQTVTARLVGTQVHNGQPLGDVTLTGNTHGIPGLPVTFTVAAGNGTLSPFGAEGAPSLQITTTSSPLLDTSLSGGFATVSWNFPIDPATGRAVPGTYTLQANGPATGGPVIYTAVVAGSPPTVSANGPYTVLEGGTVLIVASGSDDETQTLDYAWDLDHNGTFETAGQGVVFSAAAIDGPAIRTVSVRATDPSGLTAVASVGVVIDNAAPSASFSHGPTTEGTPVMLTLANPIDPSAVDQTSLHYYFDCGDDATFNSHTYATAGTSPSMVCPYDDGPSVHGAQARIFDKDGGSSLYQTQFTVENVAPHGTLTNNGPATNGVPVTISFTNVGDPSNTDNASLHFAYACDGSSLDGATYGISGTSSTQSCTYTDGPTTHTVRARVIDKDEGYTEYQTGVTVGGVIIPPPCTINCTPCTVSCTGIPPLSAGSLYDAEPLESGFAGLRTREVASGSQPVDFIARSSGRTSAGWLLLQDLNGLSSFWLKT
jgi:hypothetical protein